MKEQLISFKTAKLAKEKGFDIPLQHTVANINQLYDVDNNKIHTNSTSVDNWNKFSTVISAPTQSLLQRWLREKHGISVLINCIDENLYNYEIVYFNCKKNQIYGKGLRLFYEEALEEGLQKALKLI